MKNNLFENDKIKFSLINRLKINRKSIQLLKPLELIQNNEEDKLNTSGKEETTKNSINKNYKIKTNLFLKKFKNIKTDSELENSIANRNRLKKSKIMPLLSESKNNNKIKRQIKLKFPLNSIKNKKNYNERNDDDLNSISPFTTFDESSRKDYTKNLDKYKKIFNSVSSRLKSYYNKSKLLSNSKIFVQKNYSTKTINLMNNLQSPNKRKSSFRSTNKMILSQSNKKKTQVSFEDYTKTLNKEFNTQELINIENNQIKERLKNFKVKSYNKTPLFNTTEKLNIYLGREFNLDIRNLKKSFDKKYKVYTNSINKIKEIKHNNLFSNNFVFGFKINLNQNYNEDNEINYKSKFSDSDSKDALNTFYNIKAKDKLTKKLDLEKQLIELENKFAYIIEQEKSEKNRMGINYGEINQIIQKKFLVKEIYELDRNQKKKQFYDEQTKILYKTRNYLPNKVLKETLKQKTINKFKDITGVHFS